MKNRPNRFHAAAYAVPAGAIAAAVLSGCANAPAVTERTEVMPAAQACKQLAADLFAGIPKLEQLKLSTESKMSRKELTVAPMFDLKSGDQNASMLACDGILPAELSTAQKDMDVKPFTAEDFAKATYAVVPSSEISSANQGQTINRLRAVLVNLKSGQIVSRVSVLARTEGAERLPTPFYRDSPILVRDGVLESHTATLTGTTGNQAHARLAEDLRGRAQVSRPIDMYNRERYPDALREFKTAAGTPQGDTLTSQVGIYVAGSRVRSEADVAAASERIVRKGLETEQLGFKIFFRPNTTNPYSTPPFETMRLLGPVANQVATGKRCLTVTGHTSKSGSDDYNKTLSLRRAEFIRDSMSNINPGVRAKIAVEGKGSESAIVGNGRDDETDMVDRRVEFRSRDC